jgi:hypothetical protein
LPRFEALRLSSGQAFARFIFSKQSPSIVTFSFENAILSQTDFFRKDLKLNLGDLFLATALVSVGWGIVSMIAITNFVSERGTKINFFLYRIYIIKYVNQYKRITEEESGKPGLWFYSFVISMNLALVLTVIGAILKNI